MTKFIVASLALVAFAAPAIAADMPAKTRIYQAPAVIGHNWDGFYIGGNVGYGWNNRTALFDPNDDAAASASHSPAPTPRSHGGVFGIQAGHNWLVNPTWLLGLETDFSGASINGSGNDPFAYQGGNTSANVQMSRKLDWFGTVRARFGWLPNNNLLLYGTAGFAYGHVKEDATITSLPGLIVLTNPPFAFSAQCNGVGVCYTGSSSRTAAGWTVGAGGEYALSTNLSLKLEYLYVNLGRDSFPIAGTPFLTIPASSPSSYTTHSTLDFHVARIGLNWKL